MENGNDDSAISSIPEQLSRNTGSFFSALTRGGILAPFRKVRRLPHALVPDFVRNRFDADTTPVPPVTNTTWMDGLRGWSAVFVFNYHFFFAFTTGANIGFGPNANYRSFFELPIVRLVYDGPAAVLVFFTVAGYVCSMRPLQNMTDGHYERLGQNMASSVFRRFFRLYFPVFAITFMTALAAYCELFDMLRPMMAQRKTYFPGAFFEAQPEQSATLLAQLKFWTEEMSVMTSVFREKPFYSVHDPHLWTIPFEFRSSMHLYIILLGLARCRPLVRIYWLCGISLIYLHWARWEVPLFLLGAAVAQYDVLRRHAMSELPRHDKGNSTNDFSPSNQRDRSPLSRLLRFLSFLIALYLLSFPIGNFSQPAQGYTWLNNFTPSFYRAKEKFPKSIGILLFFCLLTTSSPRHYSNALYQREANLWHRVLTCPLSRYLAKNMFALYLVHGPLLHLIGYGLPYAFWKFIPRETSWGYHLGLGLGWLFALFGCICAADVFTREVDARCARIVKWIEKVCFVQME